MSQQMQQFTPGRQQTYRVAKPFSLGRGGVALHKGDQLDYDGSTILIPGHNPISYPELRGAIRQGWVVLAEEYDEYAIVRPVSANMQLRNAQGGNPMDPVQRNPISSSQVESEEREVSNVRAHANGVRQANATNYRRGAENTALPARFAATVEDQEGVVVSRQIHTPAKQVTNLEKTSVQEAISQANSVRIDPGQGVTREEKMAAMSPRQAAEYAAEIESRRAVHAPETAGRPVTQLRAASVVQREGMTVRTTVGSGFDMSASFDQDAQVVTESEGIRFTNTNIPPPKAAKPAGPPVNISGSEDTRRRIAKMVCADFPENYGFDDSDRKKIARLQADYEDRPDVIKAVYAAESDAMKQRLTEEFPSVFA